jgi:hypothetical protein
MIILHLCISVPKYIFEPEEGRGSDALPPELRCRAIVEFCQGHRVFSLHTTRGAGIALSVQ